MNSIKQFPDINRRVLLSSLAVLPLLSTALSSTSAVAQTARSTPVLERRHDKVVDPRFCRTRHNSRWARLRAGRPAHRDLRQ